MHGMKRTIGGFLVLTLIAAAFAGPAAASAPDPAGGEGAPITLKLGAFNGQGTPTSDGINDFVARVATLSNGSITVEPSWGLVPEDPSADKTLFLADRLHDGTLDAMVLGARFWERIGVPTFDALQTPFQVTSDALLNAVATSPDVTGPMLEGATAADAVGLAIWPESVRHPTSFGEPLLAPGDFAGKTIIDVPAAVPDAIIGALGAEPSGLGGAERDDAITSHAVDGIDFTYRWMETALDWAIAGSTTTGNITPYAGYNVLAVSKASWDRLSPGQQQILRDAADETLQQLVAANPTDATDAATYCAAGGRVVLASATDLADLRGGDPKHRR